MTDAKHRCPDCGFLHSRRGPYPERTKALRESNARGAVIRDRAADRQVRVVTLRNEGKTYREIGEALEMSGSRAAEIFKRHLRKERARAGAGLSSS